MGSEVLVMNQEGDFGDVVDSSMKKLTQYVEAVKKANPMLM